MRKLLLTSLHNETENNAHQTKDNFFPKLHLSSSSPKLSPIIILHDDNY